MSQQPAELEAAGESEPAKRPLARRVRKLLHPIFAQPLLRVAEAVVPRLYVAYMAFVWATSRVEMCGWERAPAIADEHDGFVGLLWHDEVFSVAWAYRAMRPHTLANLGDSGEMITRMLELCGYVVFRGGSSRRKSRERTTVLVEMIRHMQQTPRVIYGITVDGSHGPYHVMKPGALLIAKKCRKAIVLVRTRAKRNLRLPTWDRMMMPLPFNRIRQYLIGPFFTPETAGTAEGFEAWRREMEHRLEELDERSKRWD